MLKIRFKTSIADAHCDFVRGRVVSVRELPLGWERWLETDVIEILPSDTVERAEQPQAPEVAVAPIQMTRRQRRRAAIA